MCVVSMIGDHYRDKWVPETFPGRVFPTTGDQVWPVPEVPRQEFDKLKADVAEMLVLLKRAKKYDQDNGEPDCEIEEKMALLRKVAKLVGVDLDKELAK